MELTELTRTVRTKVHVCGCGCWVWTGSTTNNDYPGVKMHGKRVLVHRYVFEKAHRALDEGETVDHLCDRHHRCINPDHMEAVSLSENSRRANTRRWHTDGPDRSLCTYPNTTSQGETP